MKTTYKQFKDALQKEYDSFPFWAAFSNEQLEEMKIKLNVSDNSELLSIWYWVYIRKTDREAYREMIKRQDELLNEFLKAPEQLKGAIKYELSNHEYCITYEPEPALEAIWLVYDSMTPEQKEIFQQAKKEYLAQCEW